MSSAERGKFEYENENELILDYKKNINNQANLNLAVEYLYETLVEETIMGVAFQCHYESKFPEVFNVGSPTHSDEKKYSSSSQNDYGSSGNNKFLNCKCMNCEKTISVSKYASHLENCMGLGRNSSRLRLASKKTANSQYYDPESDDDRESDANWTAKEKTKKKPQGSNGRNGKNKNKNYM